MTQTDTSVHFNCAIGGLVEKAVQETRRRDAEENRVRLIAAARDVFMSEGFDVPLETIARRAGVGRATLYRNFADRYALGAAIIEEDLEALEELARSQAQRRDALLVLLKTIVEENAQTYALVPALLRGPNGSDLEVLVPRVMQLFSRPLEQAIAAGLVRPDLTLLDVVDLLAMVSMAVPGTLSIAARRERAVRALDLLFHGVVARESSAR